MGGNRHRPPLRAREATTQVAEHWDAISVPCGSLASRGRESRCLCPKPAPNKGVQVTAFSVRCPPHLTPGVSLLPHIDVMTLQRYDAFMSLPKRATVYFEPEIHRALRLKAAATDRSISDMVNDAVKLALAEDAEDLAAFEERAHEKSVDFETVVRSLRRRGKI